MEVANSLTMPKKSKSLFTQNYSDNVFINCPFDGDYKDIFHAVVFAISDCGFIPRCALENPTTNDVRINKIIKMIKECKYAVHDISRTELDRVNKLPRFNMPLELGIFIGCEKYLDEEKSYIVLDKEKYRYQKFISDISGQDIRSHNNNHKLAIKNVREYLFHKSTRKTIPSGDKINKRFISFNKKLPSICKSKDIDWDYKQLNFMEYYHCIKAWLNSNVPKG